MNIHSQVKNLSLKLMKVLRLVEDRSDYLLILFVMTYTVVFSYYTILKHYAFESTGGDLGIFNQALWSTLHYGKNLSNTIEGGCHFRMHFSPVLYLLLPIYAIHQAPETLLVLQALFLALGALPLYWLARDKMNKAAGIMFAALYLIYPPLHCVNWFDFHPEKLFPAFFLFAFYYFKKMKWFKYFTFLFLALMCTEVTAFVVVPLGLYGLWLNRKSILKSLRTEPRKLVIDKGVLCSLITIASGLLWFVFAMKVISYFNPNGYPHYHLYDHFGKGIPSIILGILQNPIYAFQVALTPYQEKFLYLTALFAPLVFTSFLGLSVIMLVPWLTACLLANKSFYWSIYYQKTSLLIPVIFISAIYGVKSLATKRKIEINQSVLRKVLILMVVSSMLSSVTLSPLGVDHPKPEVTLHDETLRKCIELIPRDASLFTQNDIHPHVSQRLVAAIWYDPSTPFQFEYIMVDTTTRWYWNPVDPFQTMTYGYKHPSIVVPDLVKSGEYGLVTAIDGIWLLKRDYEGEPVVVPSKHGLMAKFYNNENVTGEVIFEEVFLRVFCDWGVQSPFPTVKEDNFSAVFQGYLHIPETRVYTFQLVSDDGSRLYIDGRLFLDGWGPQIYDGTSTILLQRGFHEITVNYVEHEVHASVRLYWKPPWKRSFEIIPAEYLYLSIPSSQE